MPADTYANVTITASTGPGEEVTALVFNRARKVSYHLDDGTIEIVAEDGKSHYFQYSNVATVTHTIAGLVTTVTIST